MDFMSMLGGGGGGGMNPLTGIGMPGGPGGMGGPPGLPPQLMNQIQPSANPQQATSGGMGGMMDPRIMALIQALRGGGGMGR